jgi:hypothetical protein
VRLRAAAAALAALLGGPASAALADEPARTPDRPLYTLTLRSDALAAHWRGHESVSFENAAAAPLARVYLRLWDNGITGCQRPGIRVTALQGGTGGALTTSCTVLPVDLDTPVAPGARGSLSFDVAIEVPKRNDRFGRISREVLVGNAIPLLAIQDGAGWHLDPYTAHGESFYSQIARFRVTFDTPKEVQVASTGSVARTARHGDRVTRVVDARQVRDFAWVAGPLGQSSRRGVHGVRVRVWHGVDVPPPVVLRTLQESLSALADYDRRLGRYPYGELDVVLGTFTGFGGMEYPALVMTADWDVAVAHEIAHQWWYGIVGDDEYHDPWLDEAFATWTEARHDLRAGTLCAQARFANPEVRVTAGMDYWDAHPREYSGAVYNGGACALQDLSDVLGADRFATLLRNYVADHRFGWSTTQAFQAAAQQAASQLSPPVDLTGFWRDHRVG